MQEVNNSFILRNQYYQYHNFRDRLNLAANFPDVGGATFEGKTIFIGGGDSDYIPVADHDGIKSSNPDIRCMIDNVTPDFTEIRETFPTASFEYVEGAGHWVHSQKPKEFMQVLERFLDR